MRPRGSLFAALIAVAGTAAAQPRLSPAQPTDAPMVGPKLLEQSAASIAFGAGVYLAVWADDENTDSDLDPTTSRTVRAARLDANGAPIDSFAVEPGTRANAPAVAFDGQNFLVVWNVHELGWVRGRYLTPNNQPVGPSFDVAHDVAVSAANRFGTVVAGGGGHALVAWQSAEPAANVNTIRIRGALLDGNGAITASEIAINTTLSLAVQPPAARWDDVAGRFLVAWQDELPLPTIRATTVTTGGTVGVEVQVSDGATPAQAPTIASDGQKFLVAWHYSQTTPDRIAARAVDFLGALAAAEFTVAQSNASALDQPQATALANGEILLVWESTDQNGSVLQGGRVTTSGARSDGDGALLASDPAAGSDMLPGFPDNDDYSRRASLASNGTGALLVWQRNVGAPSGRDVMALPIDPAAMVLAAHASATASVAVNAQRSGGAASDGKSTLIVWSDLRAIDDDIYGLLVAPGGVAGAPFLICGAPGEQVLPAVAALPSGGFAVAWSDGRSLPAGAFNIYQATVDDAGVVSAAAPIAPSSYGQFSPVLAANARGLLVAWEDWRAAQAPNSASTEVWSQFVPIGGPPPAPFRVAAATSDVGACDAALAWDGQSFLVAWETPCAHFAVAARTPIQPDVMARWLGADGLATGPSFGLATTPAPEVEPALVAGGDGVFASWRNATGGANQIVGARLDDGAAAPPTTKVLAADVAMVSSKRERPALAWIAAKPGTLAVAWIEGQTTIRMNRFADNLSALDMDETDAPGVAVTTATPPVVAAAPAFGDLGNPNPTQNGDHAFSVGYPFPASPLLAVDTSGAGLVAATVADSNLRVPRLVFRPLAAAPNGTACSVATGCAEAICSGGVCCDTPCDGMCQACSAKGCVDVPPMDPRCPAMPVSCAALTTECRIWADPPASRCAAFAECAVSQALSECTSFTDAPDGTACDGGRAVCSAGSCVYTSVTASFVRKLPIGGCQVAGGHGASTAWVALLLIALLAVLVLKRARRVLACLWFFGCGSHQVALDINLRFDDSVLTATHHARVIMASSDRLSFPPTMMPQRVKTGLEVANYDADGDGRVDVVLELGADYAFDRLNRFRFLHEAIDSPIKFTLRAEAFDGRGNRFARLGGAMRDPSQNGRPAILNPGQETRAGELEPRCINDQCADGTQHVQAGEAAQTVTFRGAQMSALAAGNLTGAGPALAAGAMHEPLTSGRPNAGMVVVYLGGRTFADDGDVIITAGAAGDQLGASLAIGDVTDDGIDDLLIGAPGFSDNRGAVYVLPGGGEWPSAIDLTTLPATASVIVGARPGDRLGSAVVALPQGAAVAALLAGAEGAAAVYAVRRTALKPGGWFYVTFAPSLVGPAGSRLGASLAVARPRLADGGAPRAEDAALVGQVAAGAPGEKMDGALGAVYRFGADELTEPGQPAASKRALVGQGGGFGATLAFAAVGPSEPQALVVGSPGENAVRVFSASGNPPSVVRASGMVSGLGTSLARLPRDDGDLVVAGASSSTATAPGAAYLVGGATLRALPMLQLDAAGSPAAAALVGAREGDSFGAHIVVGDFDQDDFADLAIAAAQSILIFRGPLP